MKELLAKTSATSAIAVLIMVLGFGLLYGILFFPTTVAESMLTQVVAGDIGIMMAAALYYFGASKNRPANANTDTGDSNANPPVL